MKHTSNATDLIKKWESFKSNAYICPAGIPTIGYGSTRVNGVRVVLGQVITMDDAIAALNIHIMNEIEPQLNKLLKVPVTQNQYDAMVSLIYNIGIPHFIESSVLRFVNQNKFFEASGSFMLWNKAKNKKTGKLEVLDGLTNRRQEERNLFDRKE